MATHYIENESSSNQYYFDSGNNTTSTVQRSTQETAYNAPISVTTTTAQSEFTPYPAGVAGARSQHQQIRTDRTAYTEGDPYQLPQQHQSVAGFTKSTSQQHYQSSPSPSNQVKATVRSVTSQEQQNEPPVQYQQRQPQGYNNYEQQSSPQSSQTSTQNYQHQYESHHQVGQSTNAPNYYQIPSTVQYTHQELDQKSDSSPRARDQHIQQAQQVPVRTVVSSSSHQQHEGSSNYQYQQSSPKQIQQHEDQLQQYYSQLTPEQYQQLLRQQQIQRQQQEEQKRQQYAQQQYYLQQQERQRTEQQQQQQQHYQPMRANQESHHYDEYQQRRIYQSLPNQEQQYRQPGQDQFDIHQQRPQSSIQPTISSNVSPDSYRQQTQHSGQHAQSDTYYEQQQRIAVQQASPPSTYQQEQYRSMAVVGGGQQNQQVSPSQQQPIKTDAEQQRQEEADYYAAQLALQQQQQQQERERVAQLEIAQRQQAAQLAQQQQQYKEQQSQQQILQAQQAHTQPVGLQGLRNRFTGPTIVPTYGPKPKTFKQHTTSTYTTSTGPDQKTTTTTTTVQTKSYSMTYSALPGSQEPPVNSTEYFQMMQQGIANSTSSNAQQSALPPHMQGPAPGFDALRNRFKGGSTSEIINSAQANQRQTQSTSGNSSLSSLRGQYLNRAKESTQAHEESFSQKIQSVSQSNVVTINSSQQQQSPQQPNPPASQTLQEEEQPAQSQTADDQVVSSDGAVAEGGSSSGASPFENDPNLTTSMATSEL